MLIIYELFTVVSYHKRMFYNVWYIPLIISNKYTRKMSHSNINVTI